MEKAAWRQRGDSTGFIDFVPAGDWKSCRTFSDHPLPDENGGGVRSIVSVLYCHWLTALSGVQLLTAETRSTRHFQTSSISAWRMPICVWQ